MDLHIVCKGVKQYNVTMLTEGVYNLNLNSKELPVISFEDTESLDSPEPYEYEIDDERRIPLIKSLERENHQIWYQFLLTLDFSQLGWLNQQVTSSTPEWMLDHYMETPSIGEPRSSTESLNAELDEYFSR